MMKLKLNVGTIDRVIRIVLGLVLVATGYFYNYWIVALGVLFTLTGVFSFCWLYALFGISTKKKE